jgi:hypothetical protein
VISVHLTDSLYCGDGRRREDQRSGGSIFSLTLYNARSYRPRLIAIRSRDQFRLRWRHRTAAHFPSTPTAASAFSEVGRAEWLKNPKSFEFFGDNLGSFRKNVGARFSPLLL